MKSKLTPVELRDIRCRRQPGCVMSIYGAENLFLPRSVNMKIDIAKQFLYLKQSHIAFLKTKVFKL